MSSYPKSTRDNVLPRWNHPQTQTALVTVPRSGNAEEAAVPRQQVQPKQGVALSLKTPQSVATAAQLVKHWLTRKKHDA